MSIVNSGDSDSKMVPIAEDDFQENTGQQQRPATAPERSSITDTSELSRASWKTARTDVLKKYDLNNDGKFDGQEVENIINEYINTLNKHANLSESHKTQKRIIAFGAIMIIILSLSNLGTGLLAATLAKETRIIDGKMVSKDGTQSAVSTETAVKSFSGSSVTTGSGRRLNADGRITVACYTDKEVEQIFETVAQSGMVNTVVRDKFNRIEEIIPIRGNAVRSFAGKGQGDSSEDMIIAFPDVDVKFERNHPSCMPKGRRLAKGDDPNNGETKGTDGNSANNGNPRPTGTPTMSSQPSVTSAPSVRPTKSSAPSVTPVQA